MSLLVTLQAVLLDGKTGEVLGKLGEGGKAHAGGIYSVSGLPCAVVGTACGGWHCVWWLALRVVGYRRSVLPGAMTPHVAHPALPLPS